MVAFVINFSRSLALLKVAHPLVHFLAIGELSGTFIYIKTRPRKCVIDDTFSKANHTALTLVNLTHVHENLSYV